MVRCCVLRCKSDSAKKQENVTFHPFPLKLTVQRQWIKATGRDNWQPKDEDHICSKHFEEQSFMRNPNATSLNPGAIPKPFEQFSLNEKTFVINVYKYVVETWQDNQTPGEENQYQKTATMLGIDVSLVHTIIQEYTQKEVGASESGEDDMLSEASDEGGVNVIIKCEPEEPQSDVSESMQSDAECEDFDSDEHTDFSHKRRGRKNHECNTNFRLERSGIGGNIKAEGQSRSDITTEMVNGEMTIDVSEVKVEPKPHTEKKDFFVIVNQ